MSALVEIYGLYDPITGALRYVGKSNNATKRLIGHLRDVGRRRTPLYDWMRSLAERGLKPELKILSRVPAEVWEHEERRLIFEARLTNAALLNIADGGDQPHCTRAQRSANGKRVADEVRASPERQWLLNAQRTMARALREGRLTNEQRAKMRLAAAKCPELFGTWAHIPDL